MNRRITVQDGAATRDREVSGPTEGATATDLPAAMGQENATAAGETQAQHGTSRLSPKTDSRPDLGEKGRANDQPHPQPHTRKPGGKRPAHPTRGGTAHDGNTAIGKRAHMQRDGRNRPRPGGKTGFPSPEPDLRPGGRRTTPTRTPQTRRPRRDGA